MRRAIALEASALWVGSDPILFSSLLARSASASSPKDEAKEGLCSPLTSSALRMESASRAARFGAESGHGTRSLSLRREKESFTLSSVINPLEERSG